MLTTSAATRSPNWTRSRRPSLVRRGEVTPAELVGWAIERIEGLNPTLNAVITPMYEQALAAAATLIPRPARWPGSRSWSRTSSPRWPGVPFSEGSRFLRGLVSHYDTELVRRLRRAGLIIVGKTNTPEFGMAADVRTGRCTAPPATPGTPTRSTSGSSGGSAAAVAARHGADGTRQRPRRLAALPGVGLRPVRAQTDPRPQPARTGVRRRGQRLGLRARAHPHRPRQRRPARRHRRARPR